MNQKHLKSGRMRYYSDILSFPVSLNIGGRMLAGFLVGFPYRQR